MKNLEPYDTERLAKFSDSVKKIAEFLIQHRDDCVRHLTRACYLDTSGAEDLFQDIVTEIVGCPYFTPSWVRNENVPVKTRAFRWLFQIAWHSRNRQVRSRENAISAAKDGAGMPPEALPPWHRLITAEEQALLDKDLAKLAECLKHLEKTKVKMYNAVRLRWLEGKTFRKIEELTNIPKATVKDLVSRGLQTLNDCLLGKQ